ncbi:MAG: nuclease [Moraxellaceae bacterium]|jgi:hypothetical protein|nr:nuclease [Moraxellaceae bacterium]
MAAVLPDPFYYLENFRHVLAWVGTRHQDLLDARERGLIARFHALPRAAQALLVRMVMRKGDLFRHSRLDYPEIGDLAGPLALLAQQELIDAAPPLALDELCGLLRKDELQAVFGTALADLPRNARKDALLAHLQGRFPDAQPLARWSAAFGDTICRLLHTDVYDRLRLMFFGNLHQDWSEFVLTELGLLKYEAVELSTASRAFAQRADVDAYLHLWHCRERLEAGAATADVLADLPAAPCANAWLEERRGRLLFAIGQERERERDWPGAFAAYRMSCAPEARLRAIRVLEQDGKIEAAFRLASALQTGLHDTGGEGGGVLFPCEENDPKESGTDCFFTAAPREEELQQLARLLPRLRRKLGLAKAPAAPLIAPPRLDFTLAPVDGWSVEWCVRAHLHADDAPVFYVENALINSLFGLLCWEAVFAPVPGAFFHAFHYGPADLHHADFHARRATEFAACLQRLETGTHRDAILATFREKHGTQSPFVFWDALDEDLLTLALDCIPPAHLHVLFTRLLADIRNNRSGFPDLIRFWPAEQRYLMLEVKGPGDRLQDNQIRWLDYCARHGIPVAVSHVTWAEAVTSCSAT